MNVRVFPRCAPLLFALALLASCSTKTKSPLDPSTKLAGLDAATTFEGSLHGGSLGAFAPRDISGGGSRFFPLDSGNVWVYTLEQRSILTAAPAPPDTIVERGTVTTRMLGKFDFGGTPYTLSTETTDIREREFELPIYYRQDATGLYELDLPIRGASSATRVSRLHDAITARIARARPETRAASLRALADLEAKLARVESILHATGPVPATGPQGQPEIQRLAYPLAVGRQWIVRADPLFTERVEARETVVVGSSRLTAWRVRIESDLFGPEDRVQFWVSHEGELRFRYHLEGVNTDIEGNPAGIVITDQDQRLVQYRLVGSPPVGGPIATSPFGGHATLREVATR